MKKFLLLLLLFNACASFAQPWYSKIIDPFGGKQEKATDFVFISEDTMVLRAFGWCTDRLCTSLGKYSTKGDVLFQTQFLDKIQGGFSVLNSNDRLILASEERIDNKYIGVSSVDKSTLNVLETAELKIQDEKYFDYFIKKGVEFCGKFVVGGEVQDKTVYVPHMGWYNYQQSTVLFVIDKHLQIDTTLILPPSSGAYLRIEDLSVGADSVLYIAFRERYLHVNGNFQQLIDRNVIYGFDKNFQRVFQWVGPMSAGPNTRIRLTTGQDSTIYLVHERDYRPWLTALQPDGTPKWECLVDSIYGKNANFVAQLAVAANGDVLGTGIVASAADELGWSGLLFRISHEGELKWRRAFRLNKGFDPALPPYPFETGLEDLAELPNGDIIAAGFVRQYIADNPDEPYNYDIWIVRTSAEGCLWNDCPYIQEIVSRSNYIPFVTPANEWVVDYKPPHGFPAEIRRYTFTPDSVLLGGKHYRELIYSKNMSGGPWIGGKYYREENGRVFKWAMNDPEQLVYDMHMGIGDSLPGYGPNAQATRYVTEVGMTQLLDGLPRKTITLATPCFYPYPWVEGAGELMYFLDSETACSLWDGVQLHVRCFSTNGQLLYLRPGLSGCYTSGTEEQALGALNIFPNPSEGLLNLSLEHEEVISDIAVFDNLGRLSLQAKGLGGSEAQLRVGDLPAGMYLAKATTISGKVYVGKFWKK